MVRWEVAIGRMRSVCDRVDSNFAVSLWMFSQLRRFAANGMTRSFVDEMRLEAIRKKDYPHQVSRLQGVFLFDNPTQVQTAIKRWNLTHNTIHQSQINFSATNVTRVDSEWITHCLGQRTASKEWMHRYWSGEPHGEKPLTETLASGIGLVLNNSLRIMAYEGICHETPLISKVLSLSCAAFFCGHEEVGDCVPGLTQDDDLVRGNYYIDMRGFTGEMGINFEECVKNCMQEGVTFPYAQECDQSKDLQLPDFRSSFELKLDDQGIAALNAAIHGA